MSGARKFTDHDSALQFARQQTLATGVASKVSRTEGGWLVEHGEDKAEPVGAPGPTIPDSDVRESPKVASGARTRAASGEKTRSGAIESRPLRPKPIEVVLDRKKYKWSETGGITDDRYMKPPQVEAERVRTALEPELKKRDIAVRDGSELLKMATRAKNDKWYARCLWIAEHMLSLNPKDERAAVMQSSALRTMGRAEEAIEATEPFAKSGGGVLLTTRAAALLDVGRLQEAEQCAKRAYARGGKSGPLSLVFKRIESGG